MVYRPTISMFLALLTASVAGAQVLPAAGQGVETQPAEFDLTGYWRRDDGQIFYFVQVGSSLTSRHSKRAANRDENEINFTATIHGNLIYGAHRASMTRALQQRCSRQIWVGMGLTFNAERNDLTGFRGDRIINPKNCSVKDSDPVGLVYTRMEDTKPLD